MRYAPPFSCLECDVSSDEPDTCRTCGASLVDTNGVAALLPHDEQEFVPHMVGTVTALAALGALFLTASAVFLMIEDVREILLTRVSLAAAVAWLVFGVSGFIHRRLSAAGGTRSRRARATRDASPLRSIAAHDDGVCRVRGRARVLRPAVGETEVAAYYRRYLEPLQGGANARLVLDAMRCGRFAVVDDTGVAVVDDDALLIWSLVVRLPSDEEGEITFRDGQTVEVIGPARWEEPEDTRELRAAVVGYRGEHRAGALVFHGSPDAPLLVLVE